jgi:hypothetical protein
MKLVRIVIFTFNPTQNKWKNIEFDDGQIKINTFTITKNKEPDPESLLVRAEIYLKSNPQISKKGALIIPEDTVKLLEKRIEILANLISVSEMCERKISSASPCIALKPESPEELDWLNNSKGIPYILKSNQELRFSLYEEFQKNKFLVDRLDGVAIMAEALSCSHLTGRLHEFMRLFERAFALSSTPLIKPLSNFLVKSKIKITKKDVSKWILDLRHPATHADKKDEFVTEADVRPFIYLIEEAAYDVLFNKSNWRDSSITRRKIFSPQAGVGNDNVVFIKKDTNGLAIQTALLDPFGSYPYNLEGILTTIPQDLWFKKFEEDKKTN